MLLKIFYLFLLNLDIFLKTPNLLILLINYSFELFSLALIVRTRLFPLHPLNLEILSDIFDFLIQFIDPKTLVFIEFPHVFILSDLQLSYLPQSVLLPLLLLNEIFMLEKLNLRSLELILDSLIDFLKSTLDVIAFVLQVRHLLRNLLKIVVAVLLAVDVDLRLKGRAEVRESGSIIDKGMLG